MPEFLACIIVAAGPAAFIVARIAVGRRYRSTLASEPAPCSDPLRMVRGRHPAIVAALAGHPECNEKGRDGIRQVFDCALATLMDLSARGALRLRSVATGSMAPTRDGHEKQPGDTVADAPIPSRPVRRSSAYATYETLFIERTGTKRATARAQGDGTAAALDPLDRLALEALLPGEGAICAADLLTWEEKRWSEVRGRLAPFHDELKRRLWQEGYLEAAFKPALVLVRWPFRLTMLWMLACLAGMVGGMADLAGPATVLWALLLVTVLTARATIPIGSRLTSRGFATGRAALALRDTLATGSLDELRRREGASSAEAALLRHASSWGEHSIRGVYLGLRASPEAWRIALELAICGGDMQSADGPQGFGQTCRELEAFVRSAPDQVWCRNDFRALTTWCTYGEPSSAGSTVSGASDTTGYPPLAVRMHDIALMNCAEFSS